MDTKEVLLGLVMVISAFFLAERSLAVYERPDNWIIITAVVLALAVAAMMISISIRLRRIEQNLVASERVLRVGIQSVEERLDSKIDRINARYAGILEEISKRMYR
jgi:hypothetical protein